MRTRSLAHPLLASSLLALLLALPAFGADTEGSQKFVQADSIKWGDAPPSLPKGAKVAVLSGDPSKAGPFVMRLRAPAGYRIPPHWHSKAENLTIVSGALYLGSGDKAQDAEAHALKAGGFHYLPENVHHYAFSKVPTIVQVHGEGPFDIHYVNDADDPQKAAAK